MAAGSSPIAIYQKDPVAILDYTLDWKNWLIDDTISSIAWTVPGGISNAGTLSSSTTTTIWLSGGAAGSSYSIYVTIQTVAGRTEKRTFRVNVVDR